MSATLKQVIFSLATITWGVVPVYFYSSGLVVRYLSPTFHLATLIGGLAMIVLGLFNLLHAHKKVGCGHDHHHDDHDHKDGDHHHHDCDGHHHEKDGHSHDHEHHEHDHDHSHHDQNPVTAIVIMILPVILCSAATNHDLSERALMYKQDRNTIKKRSGLFAQKREPFTRATIEKSTTKTEDGYYLVDLTSVYWSAGDEEMMTAYGGLPVEVEGRLLDEDERHNPKGNRKQLYRVYMNCCAADAQVFGISLEFDGGLPTLPNKTWVTARGVINFDEIGGQNYAYLKVSQLEKGSEPRARSPFSRGGY